MERSSTSFHPLDTETLIVGDQTFKVEIADTDEERRRGLSNREPLESARGMLFIFEEPAQYQFWMKDMLFPIDIIWIDQSWQVAGIARDIGPETYPLKFSPSLPVRYVLEVNSNSSIDIGERVYLSR